MKISWSDAEQLVRQYRKEQGLPDRVDLDTVAANLGLSTAEAIEMLERANASSKHRRFTDRSGLISAGLAFGIAGIAAVAFFMTHHGIISGTAEIASNRSPMKQTTVCVTSLDDNRFRATTFNKDSKTVVVKTICVQKASDETAL